jgi:ATP/maltotriose-dependent transcriptional regulator MalT
VTVVGAQVGFVGRQVEIGILNECLAAARLGNPQVVYVEGDAGAGKSTLLSRFITSVSDAAVLEVAGDEAEALLAYGIIDQLQPDAAREPGMDPMAVGSQLLDLFDQLQTDDAVAVLAIDDLQWADRPSSRAVLFALRRLRADKVLTIVTSRPGVVADPSWARFVAGDSRVTRIRLGGLNAAEVTKLANSLGLGTLTERGASRLIAHTEGNALYCMALLDEIGVAGLSAAGNDGLPAPRELSAVILARVAALPAPTQTYLRAASVFGQHGPASVVAAIAQLGEAEQEIDEAVAAGLLIEGPSRSEVSFAHPLYRAAVYGDLPPTLRRELHARAAELAAGHARLTHLVAASIGQDEALASELEATGHAAAVDGDSDAAAWAIEQAATLSPAAADRERRLLDAAAVLLNAADTSSAARVLESCQLASPRRDALTGLLDVFSGSPTAESRLLAAWDGHDATSAPEIGARAATSLTNLMVMYGRSDEALTWADRAIDATTAGSALRAMARTGQAYAFAAAGRSTEGLHALDFLPPAGNEVPIPETDALIMRGILKIYSDDLPGAITDLNIAAARLRTGLPSTYPGPCLASLSDAHFRRGDWDAATANAQRATSLAQDTDRPLDLARAHSRSAQVLACRGQWTAALTHVAAARAAAERLPVILAVATSAVAEIALASARGDHAEVLAAVGQVRATNLVDVGGRPGIFNWRGAEIDALIRLGQIEAADAALNEFVAAMPTSGLSSAELSIARCRGNLAASQRLHAEAEREYSHAHVIEAQVPMPFEVALLGLDHGRHLRAMDDHVSAIGHLERAHSLFSDLGADPYVLACAEELRALQIIAEARSPAAVLGLSRAELAVARLVATGMTNREVAGELYLSVKTVEYHLRNSYMKLDITSRRELSALLR